MYASYLHKNIKSVPKNNRPDSILSFGIRSCFIFNVLLVRNVFSFPVYASRAASAFSLCVCDMSCKSCCWWLSMTCCDICSGSGVHDPYNTFVLCSHDILCHGVYCCFHWSTPLSSASLPSSSLFSS